LNQGFLKLFAWSKDFNPNVQQHTSAQVWVRIYGLSQEYWRPPILFAIASSVGTPICTDAVTTKPMFERTFGHFVRVLVDMDLTQQLRHKVLVERVGYASFVELDYENLPPFCSHCRCIGHFVENCRKIAGKDKEQAEAPVKKRSGKEQNKVYVQAADKRIEQSRVNEVSNTDAVNSKPIDVDENVNDDIIVIPEKNNSDIPQELGLVLVADKDKDNEVLPVANRFAGLQQDTHNVLIEPINHDDVTLETIDSDCSHESDFVETTQFPLPKDTVGPVLTLVSDIPPKVQHDMEFLKESWANMQEQADAEATRLAEAEAPEARLLAQQEESNFQTVSSKNKKKKSKSNSQLRKASVETRSKVSSSKPFR
jgi:hypothetical protein